MKVKVLGAHNTESNQTRYPSLLLDDILVLDAGGLTSSLSFVEQLKIRAVLLTHHHYDHVRDIPALAMNFFLRGKTLDLYSSEEVNHYLKKYFLDGGIYPDFHQRPPEKPTLRMHILNPGEQVSIQGYQVTPVPVIHSIPAVGYEIASEGKNIFYTGDTGPGLTEVWQQISPQVLFIEVTASNRWEESVKNNGHLTPNLLKSELTQFSSVKGYLPQVITVHSNPESETQIKSEISRVARELNADIRVSSEGMVVEI